MPEVVIPSMGVEFEEKVLLGNPGRCQPSRSPYRPPSFMGPRTGSILEEPPELPWTFQSLNTPPPMREAPSSPRGFSRPWVVDAVVVRT